MQSFRVALMLLTLPTVLAAAAVGCSLGANKCDDTNTLALLCDSHGWKVIETCYTAGACHVGPAGNVFCDKPIECTPATSQCDASNYVSMVCNQHGFWDVARKCAKPGCCEVQNGKAGCKAACGIGLKPPSVRSAFTDDAKLGAYCSVVGERYCDANHDCIFKCSSNHALLKEYCCTGRKCYYNNASLEPYCA
ncbi:hypothetical protein C7974DRAFT_186418 [Boeremia exigua]|uniref:uncharacterized protein n=1 Tax=Boeremia exigua TaxID=749465 RepID=UPI001E8EF172|nr:uncharacterized protein C7974DRAFT_186418 [Boeremia exigua]KAH6629445.1 hypothetical protein C7974DRAFT_186418 [Boeremia exigua]